MKVDGGRERSAGPDVLFWVLVSAAGVLVRGVRWDETYSRVQVLLGLIHYPPGHPFLEYVRHAFTLQYVLAETFYRVLPSAWALCGLRQVITVCAVVVPAFLLASLVGGRKSAGHVAALLSLAGALQPFGSYYPIASWPDKFTAGPIGTGFMLFTLYLLLAGKERAGYLSLGLAPAIHIGQTPVLALVAAARALLRFLQDREWTWARKVAVWFGAGFAISLATFFYILHRAGALPAEPPYVPAANYMADWRLYTLGEDVHRSFARFSPAGYTHILVGLTLAIGLVAVVRMPKGDTRRIVGWLVAYAAITAAVVYAIMAAQAVLGTNTPPTLINWMPYRLFNQVAVILLVLAAGLTARSPNGTPALAAAAAYPVLAALMLPLLPETFGHRYFATPEAAVFLLAGSALTVSLQGSGRAWILLALPVVALGLLHRFGAACMAMGMLAVWMAPRLKADRPAWHWVTAVLVIAGLAINFAGQWRERRELPVSDFDREAAQIMASDGHPDAMVVGPHWIIDQQETLGHPVLYTYETPQFITYMPRLATGVINIRRDIYDMRLGKLWDYNLDAWRNRSRQQWRDLAKDYKFGYVIAPGNVSLDLDLLLQEDGQTLYRAQ